MSPGRNLPSRISSPAEPEVWGTGSKHSPSGIIREKGHLLFSLLGSQKNAPYLLWTQHYMRSLVQNRYGILKNSTRKTQRAIPNLVSYLLEVVIPAFSETDNNCGQLNILAQPDSLVSLVNWLVCKKKLQCGVCLSSVR